MTQRNAAIVDQTGLVDGVADHRLIRLGQHVVVAEEVLRATARHERAQSAAATRDRPPASLRIFLVSTGGAQRDGAALKILIGRGNRYRGRSGYRRVFLGNRRDRRGSRDAVALSIGLCRDCAWRDVQTRAGDESKLLAASGRSVHLPSYGGIRKTADGRGELLRCESGDAGRIDRKSVV